MSIYAEKVRQSLSIFYKKDKDELTKRFGNATVINMEIITAIEAGVAIALIFKSVQVDTSVPESRSMMLQSYVNLLWNLNRNGFWVKHVNSLMPVVQSSFNAYMAHIAIELDKNKTEEKNTLSEQQRIMWLQIFPFMLGLLYDPQEMLNNSSAMLQELKGIL